MWLLAKDLERVAAASDNGDVKRVCKVLREEYLYPVSSHVLSIGESIEHLGALKALGMNTRAEVYLSFLLDAVGEAPPKRAVLPPLPRGF